MAFISTAYANSYGDTKPTLRDYMAALFQDFDIIKIEVVQRGYTVNSDQTIVVETLTQKWTDKIRETGNEATEDMQVTNEWVKEGDTWRLKSITENSAWPAGGVYEPGGSRTVSWWWMTSPCC